MRLLGGLVLAGASTFALGWGFYTQHGAASDLPPLTARHPLRSLRALFGSPRWLAGYLVGITGWALYVAALLLAPLSLVQATSAGAIGVLALLVAGRGRVRLSRTEWAGVAASVTGLALLGLSLAGGTGRGVPGRTWVLLGWVAGSATMAGVASGPLAGRLAPGSGRSVAAGLLYAAGDVATRAAASGGTRLAFVPIVLACHLTAFAQVQVAFQRGRALATAGVATVLTNALPIAAGVAVFHESIPPGDLGIVRVVAFALVVAGAALLARPAAVRPADASRLPSVSAA